MTFFQYRALVNFIPLKKSQKSYKNLNSKINASYSYRIIYCKTIERDTKSVSGFAKC